MSGFGVEVAAVHAAGHQLGTVADELSTDHGVVQGQIERLLGGAWSGSAARSFAAGWAEWTRGFRDAEAALREMVQLLESTASTYEQAEGATSRTVVGAGDGAA